MSGQFSVIERTNEVTFSSILLTNIIPFMGVFFWGWSYFSVLMVFWFETLWHSFFVALRILTAKQNPKQKQLFRIYKFRMAISLILIRTGVLLFYLIFIVLFIGMQATSTESMVNAMGNMFHGQRYMLWAFAGFTMAGIIEFMFRYYLTGEYKETSPDEQFQVVDARFVVIHLVIILGFFAAEFFSKELKWIDNTDHVMVSVFVIIKILVDVVGHLIKTRVIKTVPVQ
jgi:hypothetical protein